MATIGLRPIQLVLSQRIGLVATLLFVVSISGCMTAVASDKALPNVVFILADDLGWADLGCYGHPAARTPHLDQLARDGTRFQQAYSTGVTCCPARTGLMTGRLPASFRVYPANGGFGERPTITALLHAQGYATGHFGKWHIGPEESSGTYGIERIGTDEPTGGKKKDQRGRDAHIFDEAIRFIEQHRSKPFYVNVWGHVSHHPISPPDSYVARFNDVRADDDKYGPSMREKLANCRARGGDIHQHLRCYLADVYSLDEDVGRLLQRIDDLGLREQTIVVFSSDQGPAPLDAESKTRKPGKDERDELRLNALGNTGPLRGGKHGMYEGGVRVPWIVRWPGNVPSGRLDETSVISGADWLPTLCGIANIKIDPADFDGEDASAAWFGQPFKRHRPLLWKTSNPRSEVAIRSDHWKMHRPYGRRGELELFDLNKDPGEQIDLSRQYPEIVSQLSRTIDQWNATLPTVYEKLEDPKP